MKKFPNSMKPTHRWAHGEFWNLRGQHNQEGKHTHTHTHTQNRLLTAIASRKVAQMHASTTSEQGLDREVLAASSWVLRVRTRLECPEDRVRELM